MGDRMDKLEVVMSNALRRIDADMIKAAKPDHPLLPEMMARCASLLGSGWVTMIEAKIAVDRLLREAGYALADD